MTLSLAQRRILTATANTKRNTATGSGQSAAVAYLTGILVSKPLPAGRAILERAGTDAPVLPLEMYTDDDNDVLRGDILVYSGTEYPVKWADKYAATNLGGGNAGLRVLLLEALNPRAAT